MASVIEIGVYESFGDMMLKDAQREAEQYIGVEYGDNGVLTGVRIEPPASNPVQMRGRHWKITRVFDKEQKKD